MNFEDFLCEQNRDVRDFTYALLCVMAEPGIDPFYPIGEIFPWNTGLVAEVVEIVEAILNKQGIYACRPFYDDNKQPCYLGNKCNKPNCPMRKE